MSTSGTDAFTLTANEIIDQAFGKLAVGSEGEPLTPKMYQDGRSALNLLAKTWSAQEHLWMREQGTITPVADQAAYVLPKKAMRVLSARRKITVGGYEVPLTKWSRQEYLDQPNKTSSPSTPVNFYYDPQRTAGTVYLWPAPSTQVAPTITIEYDALFALDSIIASNNEFDVPSEWLEALVYALAVRLMPQYPVNDGNLANLVVSQADALFKDLKGWDNEDSSIFLQPDYRGTAGFGWR
jgi:hypothetical protein